MGKYKLLIPLATILILMIWALPALLKAIPDRYIARLPEPMQELGLPEERNPILPTVASPVKAQELIGDQAENNQDSTSNPTPTLNPSLGTGSPTVTADGETTTEANEPPPTPIVTPTHTVTPSPTPWPWPTAARLTGFQHKFQEWNNCGPATLAMALSYYDMNLNQMDTAAVLKPNPEDRNVSPQEMAAYVNDETPYHALFRVNGTAETLRRLVSNNMPVIVEIGIEPPGEFRWLGWYGHYLLIVAYDDDQEKFWVYDSWFGTSEEPLQNAHPDGRELSYNDLENYWPHFNRNYVVLYRPEEFETLASIIGAEMDGEVMWQKALSDAKNDVAQQPDNAFFWFNLGTAYNALGHYEQAATAFDQSRSIGLPWRMLWYQFGPYEAYLNTGRSEDVILLADTTLKDRPYFEESYYFKGLALEMQGNTEEAQRNFESAANFNPNFAPAVEALSNLN
ncbi:MAG: C39 family peptidase [Candidatus Promineifilaceae bacterium]|nr:C39 family peptidase [Candidatus Promineifilaceae bacterium]